MMNRRELMGMATAVVLTGGLINRFVAGNRKPALAAGKFPVSHTEAEWRSRLSPAAYHVLRESGTEKPFTSPLLKEHRKGMFSCAGCDTIAYSSETKFDSHTGWPSFWQPVSASVVESLDKSYGTTRTAISCSQCGGHLGHVFNDGPKPTGLRYCMNGVALTFKPAAA